MEEIYSHIKARRKELRLTQQELADSLGYERSSIAKIEKGQVDLPLSKMREFAEKLGLPLAELLGLQELRDIDLLFDSLRPDGQEELLRYGRELASDAAYAKLTPVDQLRYIRHYTTAAAAAVV